MPDSTYHQIHFAWAEPTLLGRFGPGPAASSLPEAEQPVLRSWRDRLVPALTADYRSALPETDPGEYPETLWARAYPDGQAALVYRWPGDVRSAHAWAIVGPAHGLTLPRLLSLHENPHTRPAPRRPPEPGWATMDTLPTPEPWERTAAPGAVRTRDRRAAETTVGDEPLLVGAVAAALYRPDAPIHIALAPERADLWQAVQLRFLWGMHRILHDVLTPPRAIPAAGWSWSFSTYDPVLGTPDGQHLAFGPPVADAPGPFLRPPDPDYRAVAEGLVSVLREEGGDALARHLAERGVAEAPTFADRRALLRDWLDPRPRRFDDVPVPERLPDGEAVYGGAPLPDLPEAEAPGEEETGPWPLPVSPVPVGRPDLEADAVPGVPGGQRSLKGITEEGVEPSAAGAGTGRRGDDRADPAAHGAEGTRGGDEAHRERGTHEGGEAHRDKEVHGQSEKRGDGEAAGDNEALWPEPASERPPEEPGADGTGDAPPRPHPRIAPARGQASAAPEGAFARSGVFGAPEPHRRPRLVPDTGGEPASDRAFEPREPASGAEAAERSGLRSVGAPVPDGPEAQPAREGGPRTLRSGRETLRFLGRGRRAVVEPDEPGVQGGTPGDEAAPAHGAPEGGAGSAPGSPSGTPGSHAARASEFAGATPRDGGAEESAVQGRTPGDEAATAPLFADGAPSDASGPRAGAPGEETTDPAPAPAQDTFGTGGTVSLACESAPPPESLHQPPAPADEWTIAASPRTRGPSPGRGTADPDPAPGPGLTDGPEDRAPADAPPLPVVPDQETDSPQPAPLDYAAETEPDLEHFPDDEVPEDNWPTQYADLPLARLERWHSRRGPEGARIDIVDARAAVRAERAELQRVREERDHYHAEVQDLRREVARLDRPWLDRADEEEDAPEAPRPRRWPSRALVLILLAAFLATGLEAGARFGLGTADLFGLLGAAITGASWWPL
ncbi:hypothetical protein NGM33_00335 [Nocardiopsis dassonvillei]|uniref:hypothetical protein n=1 Tax=Nocardiopsis dassonvillei TaxID=2014 RepID=UPI0020A60A30|nr:hypothetical protein [Nocardiopsis dassonvillei]MCP3011758.1 hypothetical protein [Nocardiopsis dassonvillei]